ncbi:hypothetical protein MXB_5576 [Myxobolus squamalis]|nr:hypothetical protein MXB_5576 [Myxobolus squamalis]
MDQIYHRLKNNDNISYSLQDIKAYAENFSDHWKKRVYFFFINKYPEFEKELLKLALDAALDGQILLVGKQIIDKLQNIGYPFYEIKNSEKVSETTLATIEEFNKKYLTMESSVRAAQIIGIPESLRYLNHA